MSKMLIAVDGGPASEKVALCALGFGLPLNAEMALISVVDLTFLAADGDIPAQDMAHLVKKDLLNNHQTLIQGVFKNSKVMSFVQEGKPFKVILDVAREWGADLIVLGRHGKTGLNHLFIGSVADKVLRHSSFPILIVPLD
jgi:nucleotide-binding universal stress UspA family protein